MTELTKLIGEEEKQYEEDIVLCDTCKFVRKEIKKDVCSMHQAWWDKICGKKEFHKDLLAFMRKEAIDVECRCEHPVSGHSDNNPHGVWFKAVPMSVLEGEKE